MRLLAIGCGEGLLHRGLCAVFVGQGELHRVRQHSQLGPDTDAPVTAFFVELAQPTCVAVAVDFDPFAQVFQALNRVFGEHAPAAFFGADEFSAVDGQAHQLFLQVVVTQAVAVVQLGGLVAKLQLDPVRSNHGHIANR